jgi:hypothetical protein
MDHPDPEGADGFLADAVADAAIEERRREHWLRHRLAEAATLHGALGGAVGAEVRLDLVTGDRLSGPLLAAGSDVLAVVVAGRITWVSLPAVVAVEVAAPVPAAGPAPGGVTMAEALAELVDTGPVRVGLLGGTVLGGEVVAVGEALTLRDAGGRTAYASVDAVVWAASA